MRLTVCLPGLLLPPQALLDSVGDLPLPALAGLLGRGRFARVDICHHDWLAGAVGLAALPAAPLRLLAAGREPGRDHWICLDPVHLSVHRSGIALGDPATLALDAAEDAALRAAMAPLFETLGTLEGAAVGQWHLRLAAPAPLQSLSLPQAAGRDLDPSRTLPADWRRALADAETALHAHPVNRRREASGQPAVNSLWPWGAGALPGPLRSPWASVATHDPVVAGLARHLEATLGPPPTRFAATTAELVVLDDLSAPARHLDAFAWRDALVRLERDWFAPLAEALRAGRIERLTLAGFGGEGGIEVGVTPTDLWKFWRRPRPLAEAA